MYSRLTLKLAALAVALVPYACVMETQGSEPTRAPGIEHAAHARQAGAPGLPPAARPWPATTGNLPAQLWIELGLALYLAGDRDGAANGFRTAQRHDPGCAICFWGEALAGSPGPGVTARPGALAALDTALLLEKHASAKEAALIAALDVRFHGAPWERGTASQPSRDQDFAQAMRAVAGRFPADRTIADLAGAARAQAAAWN